MEEEEPIRSTSPRPNAKYLMSSHLLEPTKANINGVYKKPATAVEIDPRESKWSPHSQKSSLKSSVDRSPSPMKSQKKVKEVCRIIFHSFLSFFNKTIHKAFVSRIIRFVHIYKLIK
jgi:hypothetical protein